MQKGIILSSAAPIKDGGQRYQFLYAEGAAVGFAVSMIVFWMKAGFIPGIVMGIIFALLGTAMGWGIKNMICQFACINLSKLRFVCGQKIPHEQLMQSIQPLLVPYNMRIERRKDGTLAISCNRVYYSIFYNEDETFCLKWDTSLGSMLRRTKTKEYITLYKKACSAYGIIAFHIQQMCNGNLEGNLTNTGKAFQHPAGQPYSSEIEGKEEKLGSILAGIVLAIFLIVLILFFIAAFMPNA